MTLPAQPDQTVAMEPRNVVRGGFDLSEFMESFPALAGAEGGPAGLRGLVLELAVRGTLVTSVPNAEDASSLLVRVRAERERAEKRGEVESAPTLQPIDVAELPHELPVGWTWARLRQAVLTIQIGPFGSLLHQSDYVTGGTPIVNPAHIKAGRIVPEDKKGVSGATLGRLRGYTLRAGDVVMGRRGEMGKCAVVTNVEHGWLCGTGSSFIRPTSDVLPDFLTIWLRSPSVRMRLEGGSVGATMSNLNLRILNNLVLALPPLPEQKRIVAKVDQLMGLIDELEVKQTKKREVQTRFRTSALDALTKAEAPEELASAWRRVAGNFGVMFERVESLTSLRAQLLELAMRGTMTKAVRGDDGIEDLVARLAADTGTMGTLGPVAEAPFRIPDTWRWVRWGHLTRSTSSGWSPQCEGRPRTDSEWGVLKVSAVSWYVFKPEENKALPNGVKPRPEFAARSGDFLMSRANTSELVGRSVIVGKVPERLLLSDKLVRIEFSPLIEQGFVNLYNRTATPRSHYLKNASGTSASMKNISREVILSMPVPLPPFAEQKRIVAKVDQLMGLIDDLEAKLKAKEATAVKLVEAVVKELVS